MNKTVRPISRETAIELKGHEIDAVSGGLGSLHQTIGSCESTTTVMTRNGEVWDFDGDKCDD